MNKKHFMSWKNKQTFSIRKYSVGTISILLGVFLFGTDAKASEDLSESFTSDEMVSSIDNKEIIKSDIEPLNSTEKPFLENNDSIASEKEETVEKTSEEKQTVGYAVQPSEKPLSSALPRPDNSGEVIPSGSDFRAVLGKDVPVSDSTVINEAGGSVSIPDLKAKTFWIDFRDRSAVTGLGERDTLQVGTTYTKAITPDYIIKAVITELKPFAINEENMYRPDSEGSGGVPNTPAAVGTRTVDTRWSHLYRAGLVDANATVIGSEKTGGNIGFKVKVTATYKGIPVAPTVLAADAEESSENQGEVVIMTTDGTPWSIYANVRGSGNQGRVGANPVGERNRTLADVEELAKQPYAYTNNQGEVVGNYVPMGMADLFSGSSSFTGAYDRATDPIIKEKYSRERVIADGWINENLATGGIGTQKFGPILTSLRKYSVPIIKSTADSNEGLTLGVYINSKGAQHVVLGVAFYDRGDAPDSYGDAAHLVNDSIDVHPPFLGREKGDPDVGEAKYSWIGDDGNGFEDEGNSQLTGSKLIKIVRAETDNYELEIDANPNGNPEAYVRGFIDFNHNGVFDDFEASNTARITAEGKVVLSFSNPPQITNLDVENVGVRVRIAKEASEVEKAFGVATSGEVEDFKIQVIHPPRGERKETTGVQGATQTATVQFTAYGKEKNNDAVRNTMDTAVDVKIVSPNGDLVSTWTEENEGTYTVDATGNVTFKPLASFTGKAKGIVLRATDKNGLTTGWTSETGESARNNDGTEFTNDLTNINDGSHTIGTKTMDSVYIPTVTPVNVEKVDKETTGLQGQKQTATPTFTSSNATHVTSKQYSFDNDQATKTVDGEGTYTINTDTGEITFTPLPTFTGKATPVIVKQTLTVTGPDMDEDSNNENTNVTNISTTATYTPTVTAVTPTATPSTTSDFQGRTQESPIVFGEDAGNNTLNFKQGDQVAPIDPTTVKLVRKTPNSPDNQPVYEEVASLEVYDKPESEPNRKKVGTYTLSSDKSKVIFTPEKDFVGVAPAATIQAADKNSTTVVTTYTPTVTNTPPTVIVPNTQTFEKGETKDLTVGVNTTDLEDDTWGDDKTSTVKYKITIPEATQPVAVTPEQLKVYKLDKVGNYVITATPVDSDGLEGTPATYTVTVADTTKPKAPIVDPVNTAATEVPVTTPIEDDATTVTVTFPGKQPVVITKQENGNWTIPNGTIVSNENGKLLVPVPEGTVLQEGEDKIVAKVTDQSGNESEVGKGNVTNEAPKVTVPTQPKAGTVNTPVDLTDGVSTTDNEDDKPNDNKTTSVKYTATLPGAAPIEVVDPVNFTPTKPGVYTITATPIDSDDKPGEPKDFTLVVPTPAPEVSEINTAAKVVPVKVDESTTKLTVTLPNSNTPIVIEKQQNGTWATKGDAPQPVPVTTVDGKLQLDVPVPTDYDLNASETNQDPTKIKAVAFNGADSPEGFGNITNDKPIVNVPTIAQQEKGATLNLTEGVSTTDTEDDTSKADNKVTTITYKIQRPGETEAKAIEASALTSFTLDKVGDYVITATPIDSDGLPGEPKSYTVTVADTTKPKAPTIDTINTAAKEVAVSVPEEKDAKKVTVNFPGVGTPVEITKDDEGNWKIGDTPVKMTEDGKFAVPVPSGIKEGADKITATVTDESNNTSDEGKGNVTNEIPVVTVPTTTKKVESGTTINLTDGITKSDTEDDTYPATAENDAPTDAKETTLTYSITKPDGTTEAITEEALKNFTPDQLGRYTVTVTPTDSDNKVGEAKSYSIIVEDTTKPNAPTVDTVDTAAKAVPVTTPTEKGAKTVTVNFPGGSSVVLTKDGSVWKTPTGETVTEDGGKLQVPVPTGVDLNEAENAVTATVTDQSGNVSEPGKGNVTNEAPTFTVPTEKQQVEKGAKVNLEDYITEVKDTEDDKYPTTAEEGNPTDTKVTTKVIKDNGGFDPNKVGTYTITAEVTDSDGKKVEKTFTIEVKDTTAPAVPVIYTVNTAATAVPIKVDDETVELTVNFPGKVTEDNQNPDDIPVVVTKGTDGNWKVGETPVTVDENGKLLVPVPNTVDLDAGVDAITAKAKDASNNESGEGAGNVTNDKPVVKVPTIAQQEKGTTLDLTEGVSTTDTEDDTSKDDNKVTTITYKIQRPGETEAKAIEASALTSFTLDKVGDYVITATPIDSDGLPGDPKTYTVTVADTTKPKAPTVDGINTAAKVVPVSVPEEKDAKKVTVNFPGVGTPVEITKDDEGNWKIGDTPVKMTEDGKFAVPVPAGIKEGVDKITATVTDESNNTSDEGKANVTNDAPSVKVPEKPKNGSIGVLVDLTEGITKSDTEDDTYPATAENDAPTDAKETTLTYSITKPDGTTEAITEEALKNFTPDQLGRYTVTVTPTDSDNKVGEAKSYSIIVEDTTKPNAPTVDTVDTAANTAIDEAAVASFISIVNNYNGSETEKISNINYNVSKTKLNRVLSKTGDKVDASQVVGIGILGLLAVLARRRKNK